MTTDPIHAELDRVAQRGTSLGDDDVSEFVNEYGGLCVTLGAQEAHLNDVGCPVPTPARATPA